MLDYQTLLQTKQFKILSSKFKIGKVPENKDLGGSAYAI